METSTEAEKARRACLFNLLGEGDDVSEARFSRYSKNANQQSPSRQYSGASGDVDENKGRRKICQCAACRQYRHSRAGGNSPWAPAFARVTICSRYSAIANHKYSGASGDVNENNSNAENPLYWLRTFFKNVGTSVDVDESCQAHLEWAVLDTRLVGRLTLHQSITTIQVYKI